MNTHIKKFLLLSSAFFFAQNASFALDVIFPQRNPHTTKAAETYIMGNVNKHSKLQINGENVKVWHNGAFCHVVKVNDGENKFVITETGRNITNTKTYVVNKNLPTVKKAPSVKVTQTTPTVRKDYKELLLGSIITDGAPVREKPTEQSRRITHLPKNTMVMLEAEYGNWYKIHTEHDKDQLWIFKKNVKTQYPINNRYKASLQGTEYFENADFSGFKTDFDITVPFKIEEKNNDLEITFWGIKDISDFEKSFETQKVFKNIKTKVFDKNNITILIPSQEKLWGYDATYEKNSFVFKKRKAPTTNKINPLEGITIAIDAGHGGKEAGTIGPTRIPEKDVNLQIALKLQKELEKNGAKVIMTRDCDKFTEIYQRPEIAKNGNALICLSIHCNSMVDGNPYKKHGVSVFYYNEHTKQLADTIKKQMAEDLKLRDDGTNFASFVLTRPTAPMSVLIETAFMPNPYEYERLINPHFQTKTAQSVCKGLKKYLIEQTN